MKEKPLLFSGPMVRALLNGTKTQTRRLMKPQPTWDGSFWNWSLKKFGNCSNISMGWNRDVPIGIAQPWDFCPYGAPGDQLWVKETFRVNGTMAGPRVTYRADDAEAWPQGCPDECSDWIADDNNWRPSIFMRRYASRITVEITSVRAEQLDCISATDAQAEGIEKVGGGRYWLGATGLNPQGSPVAAYRTLWESINGEGSWALNPWVWVIEFKRIEP